MISPLNYEKALELPPTQFKVAVVNVLNELIEQSNRMEAELRAKREEEQKQPTPTAKRGRPSGKAR